MGEAADKLEETAKERDVGEKGDRGDGRFGGKRRSGKKELKEE